MNRKKWMLIVDTGVKHCDDNPVTREGWVCGAKRPELDIEHCVVHLNDLKDRVQLDRFNCTMTSEM